MKISVIRIVEIADTIVNKNKQIKNKLLETKMDLPRRNEKKPRACQVAFACRTITGDKANDGKPHWPQ